MLSADWLLMWRCSVVQCSTCRTEIMSMKNAATLSLLLLLWTIVQRCDCLRRKKMCIQLLKGRSHIRCALLRCALLCVTAREIVTRCMAVFTYKLCCALLRCASKTQEAQQRIEQLRTAPRNAAPQRAAYVWTALYCDSKTRSNWTHDQQHDVCVCIKLVSVLEASVYPTACCKQI